MMEQRVLVTVRIGPRGTQSYVVEKSELAYFKENLNKIVISEQPVTVYKHNYQNKEYVMENLYIAHIVWNVDGVMDVIKFDKQDGTTLSDHAHNCNKVVQYNVNDDGTACFVVHVWATDHILARNRATCVVLNKAMELNL